MIWLLLVILLIVAIVAISRSGKKSKLETEKLMTETEVLRNSVPSVADEITKLKKLVDEGILTQEEFETKKKKLLE